jgi:eukaryotic-like serine/threonine-protein kinase
MEDPAANLSLPPSLEDENISLPGFVEIATVPIVASTGLRFSPTFSPGDLLGNRFRILKFVARGGMGEVYEAEDLELQEAIALKTVLPAIARDPNALALLKSEVQLSRKVTHPNVCRIFDLACHRSASPDNPPIWFLTMELLKGHTLTQEIQRGGKLSEDRALRLALQMADGLDAVRRAHIVHGDFKSSNVLLVPLSDGSLRAVITDFGLARALETAKDSHAASVGTPAFMAPEQVKGEALSSRTDVYSFGVVLYEMVTGQWPFNADTPERIAAKRLTEVPTPPVRFVPKLDPVWNRVILRCLEREPAKRYETTIAAMDEITGRSRYRNLIVSVALLLVCLVGGVLARYKGWGPFRPKPQIAVLGWRNRSGDPAFNWVSTELSERLTGILEAKTRDAVVPQQDIDRAKIEFSIPTDRDLEKEDLNQFRTALGANSFVTGSYDVQNSRVIVDGVLQNFNGNPIARFHEEGSADNLAQIVGNIATSLAPKLDSKETSQAVLDSSASIYPKTPEGRRLYFEALEQLRSFDAVSAKNKLQQVIVLEKDSVGAHAALADAWARLKYDDEAINEGKIAAQLAGEQNLPPELVQATEARYAELQQRWSDASKLFESLHTFIPDQLKYSLAYANALTKDGQPGRSLQFLDKLSQNPSPVGDDPRIQALRSEAFTQESRFAEELKAAQASLAYATRRREKLMQAKAELEICWAQRNTGDSKNAIEACQTAQSIFSTFEDTVSAAVALNGEANIKMQQGDYKGAQEAYQQVLAITQHAGAEVDTAGALLNLAKSEIYLGDASQAEAHLHQSIDLAQRIESHSNESRARILLGSVLSDAGQKDDAAQQYEAALKVGEQTGDRDVQAFAWSGLGQLSLDRNDLRTAEDDFRKALSLRNEMGEPAGIGKLQLRLASVLLARREVTPAGELAEKALATAKKLGDTGMTADALYSLAEVDLSNNDIADSIEKSTRSVALYKNLEDPDSEAKAYLLTARAYLKEHQVKAGMEQIATAHALPGITEETRRDLDEFSKQTETHR